MILSVSGASALAAVPTTLHQQGRLLMDSGEPVTGSTQMRFTLYSAATGGEILWQDEVTADLGDAGFYSVTLGADGSPLDAAILQDGKAWLAIAVDSAADMTPRFAISSVPFALVSERAAVADSVAAGSITRDALSAGLQADTLGGLGCSEGQLAVKGASGWTCVTASSGAEYTAGAHLALVGSEFRVIDGAAGNIDAKLLGGLSAEAYLTMVEASTVYLTSAAAASSYLTLNDATSTFLTQTSAASTYLRQSDAAAVYLTQANAASTYLTAAQATNLYYTKAQGDGRYLQLTGGTVTGTTTFSGRVNQSADVYTADFVVQKDSNNVVSSSYRAQRSGRLVIRNARRGETVPIPSGMLEEMCGEGCYYSLAMRTWSGTAETAFASRGPFFFHYDTGTRRWRESTDNSGIAGNNTTQHVRNIYDCCYFTDGTYSAFAQIGDSTREMHLLNWQSATCPNPGPLECILTISN